MIPIGYIRRDSEKTWIELDSDYRGGLLGLDGFSHAVVCYWFHENDTKEKREVLQVHPCGKPANPLAGVFATHSPLRPNLIAITLCKILSIDDCRIEIEKIDAFDGSPVIDIKCYIPFGVDESEVRVPNWAPR